MTVTVENFTTTDEAVKQYFTDANSITQVPSYKLNDSLRQLCGKAQQRVVEFALSGPDHFNLAPHYVAKAWEYVGSGLRPEQFDEIVGHLRVGSSHVSMKHVFLPTAGASEADRLEAVQIMFDGVLPDDLARAMAAALQLETVSEVWIMHAPSDKYFSILLRHR